MDASRFDQLSRTLAHLLTRRTLGAVLGASAFGLPWLTEAKKKRKHKKKKRCPPCKKRKKGKCRGTLPDGTPCSGGACQGGSCKPSGDPCPGQKRCGEECIPIDQCCTDEDCPDGTCEDGVCQPVDPCPGEQLCEGECIPTNQCCVREDCPSANGYLCCDGLCTDELGEPGSDCVDDQDCCSGNCRISSLGALRCAATCRGRECSLDSQCCRGFSCEFGYCGGCADSVDWCTNDADCCFSACTAPPGQSQKSCLSFAGGPCEKNWDCWSCVIHARCSVTTNSTTRDVCQNGVCGCPYDCCSDADCFPAEFCAVDGNGLAGECMLRPQRRRRGRS